MFSIDELIDWLTPGLPALLSVTLSPAVSILVLTLLAVLSPIVVMASNSDTRETAGVLVALVGLAISRLCVGRQQIG